MRPGADASDPFDLPDYVEDSLRAWCASDRLRSQGTPHIPETHRFGVDPTYDPEWDWLDEPFPEEYE